MLETKDVDMIMEKEVQKGMKDLEAWAKEDRGVSIVASTDISRGIVQTAPEKAKGNSTIPEKAAQKDSQKDLVSSETITKKANRKDLTITKKANKKVPEKTEESPKEKVQHPDVLNVAETTIKEIAQISKEKEDIEP